MIYLLSHNDHKLKAEITGLVGNPYSFRQRWQMGGNGSGGLMVIGGDEHLMACLPDDGTIRKCNIELRPAGIIVGFHRGLETYGWVVPYYMLTIYGQDNTLSLYAGPNKLILRWPSNIKANERFLDKLMKLRAEKLASGSLP
ncbi:MAG: hypothetical protein LWX09_10200 [Bacteroidia bacterium]|jgi:hypothetical protein|nr:hypothetical protein [Bacteroidia bacterium]